MRTGILVTLSVCTGCGLTKSRTATEQLVVSDAVDRAVSTMDFSELSGRKVYFETKYATDPKGNAPAAPGSPTAAYQNYVISSVRQQLTAYDVRLQDKVDTADYVMELRIGALGTDGNELTFGLPASAALSVAGNAAGVPGLPGTPEVSVGRRQLQMGAAKLGLFAYHRESGRPVWQQGLTSATSDARDLYIFGMGPFQKGKLYNRGVDQSSWSTWGDNPPPSAEDESLAQYRRPMKFGGPQIGGSQLTPVQPATHLEPAPE